MVVIQTIFFSNLFLLPLQTYQNCPLLLYYAAISGKFLQPFGDNLSVPSSGLKVQGSWTLRKETIGNTQMSVRNYHYLPRNIPEEGSSDMFVVVTETDWKKKNIWITTI